MKRKRLLPPIVVLCALLVGACNSPTEVQEFEAQQNRVAGAVAGSSFSAPESSEIAAVIMSHFVNEGTGKARNRPSIWVDGELFGSVVTPSSFKSTSGPFDELYMGGNGFMDGIPLISEAKPGDQDYNGGRWHVNVLKENVDPDKYMNADRVEDLDLNDFMGVDVYFACPVLPQRGNGNASR